MDADMGGDATDDLEAEIGDEGDEEGEKDEEELFQDLDAIVDELQAKFDELKGEEGDDDAEEMGDEEAEEEAIEMEDEFDAELATVREYVEKVGAPSNTDAADQKQSIVAGKNDMGGTASNIAQGADEKGGSADKPKEDNAGNVNVPGAKGATKMSNESGASDSESGADNTDSLFRGRR